MAFVLAAQTPILRAIESKILAKDRHPQNVIPRFYITPLF